MRRRSKAVGLTRWSGQIGKELGDPLQPPYEPLRLPSDVGVSGRARGVARPGGIGGRVSVANAT